MSILSSKIQERDKDDKSLEVKENNRCKNGSLMKLNNTEEAYSQEYVKSGFNGTQAIKKVKPNLTTRSAGVYSTNLLKKDRVRKRILELLPKEEETSKVMSQALKSPTPNSISWKDKLRAVTMIWEAQGVNEQANKSVNIALVVQK